MSGETVKAYLERIIAVYDSGKMPERPVVPPWVRAVAGPAAIGLTLGLGACGSNAEPVGDDEICDNGVDDDLDLAVDCDDSECEGDPACEDPPEICDNRLDDDGDLDVDCEDSECADHSACTGGAEVCGNGADDDEDGYTDCCDTECFDDFSCAPMCPAYGGPYSEENCSDCRDDYDCDGLVDCEDPDCDDSPFCVEIYGVPFA